MIYHNVHRNMCVVANSASETAYRVGIYLSAVFVVVVRLSAVDQTHNYKNCHISVIRQQNSRPRALIQKSSPSFEDLLVSLLPFSHLNSSRLLFWNWGFFCYLAKGQHSNSNQCKRNVIYIYTHSKSKSQ